MKKINTLITFGLILGFSASSVLAENTVSNVAGDSKPYFDRLNQVQRNGVTAKSAFIDELLNAKGDVERMRAKIVAASHNKKRNPPVKEPRLTATKPKKTAAIKANRLENTGKQKSTYFPNAVGNANRAKNLSGKKLTIKEVRKIFYPEKTNRQLTSRERKELFRNYDWLIKQKVTLALLIAITKVEGAPSPKTVVGYRKDIGYKHKTPDCQRRIKKLTLKAHAKEQGLPQPCFITTSAGPSSAYGYGQFVYKTWKHLKKRLKFTNFSRKTQARAMLELARQYSIEGFTGLVREDLKMAVKATGPWAGSDHSNLPGMKHDILKQAHREMKELKDQSYYQKWLDEFTNDSTS